MYWSLGMIAGVGLVVGSVLNILQYQLPHLLLQQGVIQTNKITWRLHCSHCQSSLAFWISLPLIRACCRKIKCSYCHSIIDKKYTWIELGISLWSVALIMHGGWHYSTCALLVLSWGLLLLAFIDDKYYLLPDCITLPLLWMGLLGNAVFQLFVSSQLAIIGAVFGYLSLWVIGFLYRLIRGSDGIGQGDFKLLAVLGAWWGFYPLPVIVLMASGFGLVIALMRGLFKQSREQALIAFGPYLVMGSFIVMWFYLGSTY